MADVTMPQLGETVTEGTITKWFKQVGDQVAEFLQPHPSLSEAFGEAFIALTGRSLHG